MNTHRMTFWINSVQLALQIDTRVFTLHYLANLINRLGDVSRHLFANADQSNLHLVMLQKI